MGAISLHRALVRPRDFAAPTPPKSATPRSVGSFASNALVWNSFENSQTSCARFAIDDIGELWPPLRYRALPTTIRRP